MEALSISRFKCMTNGGNPPVDVLSFVRYVLTKTFGDSLFPIFRDHALKSVWKNKMQEDLALGIGNAHVLAEDEFAESPRIAKQTILFISVEVLPSDQGLDEELKLVWPSRHERRAGAG